MFLSQQYPLSKNEIQKNLITNAKIITVKECGSTNTALKEMAESGGTEWTLFCAEKQTKGKGRMNNSFFSPKTGIYMSILLRPDFSAENSLFITTLAGCAVCRAIENKTGKSAKIKWVNDLYTDSGKICGILAESAIDFEKNKIKYSVLGIGVNLFPPKCGFPDDILRKAASLYNEEIPDKNIKNILIAEIFNEFYKLYKDFNKKEHIKEYKKRSMLIGRNIVYTMNDKEYCAMVTDIDDECRLVLINDKNETVKLSSGEVKIRQW